MKSIITNLGSSVTADVFRSKMKKFVLIGSRSDNDTTLTNILENNTITDTNINNQSNITNYIITKPEDIDNSMITSEKTLVITLNLQPGSIDPTYYVYAVALVDETGDIYAISTFSENFNSISEAGEIITIRFKLTGTDIIGNEFILVSDESYITRREFIEWANNHNHDKQYATIRYLNSIIDEMNQIKENKGTIGRLEDIKSLNNNNIVNVLNEIIENLGDINSLDVTTRDSIVSAINKVYSIIGDPKKLTKYDNIIESLEEVRNLAENSKGGVFADGVIVQDVEWADKADFTYVGDINSYHGAEKSSIIDSLNEIYDEAIGNRAKVHNIPKIKTNTNYKIFEKTQDYKGTMTVSIYNKSILKCIFDVELNLIPNSIKIKNVKISDDLKNLNLSSQNDWTKLADYDFGLAFIFKDRDLYLSVKTDEDLAGNKIFDKIVINYMKVNTTSNLVEENFDPTFSIPIRENSGVYIDSSIKNKTIELNEKNKIYNILNTNKEFEAKVRLKNFTSTQAYFELKSVGSGDFVIQNLVYKNLGNYTKTLSIETNAPSKATIQFSIWE